VGARLFADTQGAPRGLGFRAQVGLEEGLARLVAWRQRQGLPALQES
jgi:nucleoside-diphosphate-sugar epimerase